MNYFSTQLNMFLFKTTQPSKDILETLQQLLQNTLENNIFSN